MKADPQGKSAARQDQMQGIAVIESSERFGVSRHQVGEAFDAALNQDGGGEAFWRPVRRGCGGRCVGPDRESSGPIARPRSEEHTSELQSLMRISYAVFCLKKKK